MLELARVAIPVCVALLLSVTRGVAQSESLRSDVMSTREAPEEWVPIDPFVRRVSPITDSEPSPLGSQDDVLFEDEMPEELQDVQYPLDDDHFLGIPPDGAPTVGAAPAWRPPVIRAPESHETTSAVYLESGQFDVIAMAPPDDELGVVSFDLRGALAFEHWPGFSVRPRFGAHFIRGPTGTDVPPRLYDVSLEARVYVPFGDRWLTEFALAPGIFSDFRNTSSDAFRIVGRALVYYRWSPELQLAVGALYLDREDVAALPAAGIIWVPDPDLRVELMAPRPRLAVRYGGDQHHERWAYVAGEFGGIGGGSFAIEREPAHVHDVLTYRDYRLLVGVEFKFQDGSGWRVEGGYLFGRNLEYRSGIGDQDLTDTALLRASISF